MIQAIRGIIKRYKRGIIKRYKRGLCKEASEKLDELLKGVTAETDPSEVNYILKYFTDPFPNPICYSEVRDRYIDCLLKDAEIRTHEGDVSTFHRDIILSRNVANDDENILAHINAFGKSLEQEVYTKGIEIQLGIAEKLGKAGELYDMHGNLVVAEMWAENLGLDISDRIEPLKKYYTQEAPNARNPYRNWKVYPKPTIEKIRILD